MAEAFLIKSSGALHPADEAAAELLRGVASGTTLKVKWTRPRSYEQHRLFFALLNKVYENQDAYESREHLRAALLTAVGHCDMVYMPHTGAAVAIPKSIAFHALDQDGFNSIFNACIEKIVQYWLPGVTEEELRAEVLEMVA